MIAFIKARLSERSTWLLIGTSVAAASALVAPWSYVSMAVGAVAALIPDGDISQ
jgi:hypothetical protein